jgi:hypothetical protein
VRGALLALLFATAAACNAEDGGTVTGQSLINIPAHVQHEIVLLVTPTFVTEGRGAVTKCEKDLLTMGQLRDLRDVAVSRKLLKRWATEKLGPGDERVFLRIEENGVRQFQLRMEP